MIETMGDTSQLSVVDTCAQADYNCENVKREILIIIIISAWKGRRKIGKKYFSLIITAEKTHLS